MIKPPAQSKRSGLSLPIGIALCAFLAVAVFFLWAEHEAHIMGALPYVLLLLCLAVHFLMHRGHGGHGGGPEQGRGSRP
jgi:hypothetical protein